MTRLLLAFVVLMACACSPFCPQTAGTVDGALHAVEGVPFRAQLRADDCGPAALASLLGHRGLELAVEEIDRVVYLPALGGSLLPDLENYALHRGFSTRSGRGDLSLLRRQVDAGRPVLIPVETGFWVVSRPHYLVVYGYDEDRFLAHAGRREGVFLDAGELDALWQKMNRLYLYLD